MVTAAEGTRATIPTEHGTGQEHTPDGRTRITAMSPEELAERRDLWVEVSVSEQLLRIWDGAHLIKEMEYATGPESDPMPIGEFTVRRGEDWFSSNGPVHLSAQNSTWFYHHVPDGTPVVIHN